MGKAFALAAALWCGMAGAVLAGGMAPEQVMQRWYQMILELVRHTPTYSPPVASRSFAYVGVTAYEAVAGGNTNLQSLAGQLNGLQPLPARVGGVYDEGVLIQAALAAATRSFFANTGPTGQRAMTRMETRLRARVAEGLPADTVARSEAYGAAVAAHILAWSANDGGAAITNMGFPQDHALTEGRAHWVPTSVIVQQQAPLLPDWGKNRPFAMPAGNACAVPAPPEYSEEEGSEFYKQAREVFDTTANITPEQLVIARFWSDDPMLSPTPPGHWVSIAMQVMERENAGLEKRVDVMVRLGVAMADAFIGCWYSKFHHDLLRPVTYIRRTMDPQWEPPLTTPPFPEYPSGHSTQSGAAAAVLTAAFGVDYAFDDATHRDDGLPVRRFASFWDAAEEAGLSRLYGGIHFRAAIERGMDQGRCIGGFAAALTTRK